MPLTKNVVSKFAKTTYDNTDNSKETISYGDLVVGKDNQYYVKINGSEILTPASVTTNINMNQPVIVMIKHHRAIVTGNYTNDETITVNNKNIANDTSSLSINTMDDADISKIFEDHPLI